MAASLLSTADVTTLTRNKVEGTGSGCTSRASLDETRESFERAYLFHDAGHHRDARERDEGSPLDAGGLGQVMRPKQACGEQDEHTKQGSKPGGDAEGPQAHTGPRHGEPDGHRQGGVCNGGFHFEGLERAPRRPPMSTVWERAAPRKRHLFHNSVVRRQSGPSWQPP